MKHGYIGDAHIGFKAYDSLRRTDECTDIFELAIKLLVDKGVTSIFCPGDLLDDTNVTNRVEKAIVAIFSKYGHISFYILGGNHDSSKTYASVSALEVLGELPNVTVLGNFITHDLLVDSKRVLAIPHMKSQREFKNSIMSIPDEARYDICLLHSMVFSKLDLGPNDLNIDQEMFTKLEKHCNRVWVGHQHSPVLVSDKVVIPGSTIELNFGELGPRYVYVVDGADNVELLAIPQPRLMERIDLHWSGIEDLLNRLYNLDIGTIYKVTVDGIPHSEYSACSAAMDAIQNGFDGDLIYDLVKFGHEEVEISTIDASFNLQTEFKLYCDHNALNYDELVPDLIDAMSIVNAEEEDFGLCQ